MNNLIADLINNFFRVRLRVIERILIHDLDSALHLAFDLARDLAAVAELNDGRIRFHVRDLDSALDLKALVSARDRYLVSARDLAKDLNLDLDRGRVRKLADELALNRTRTINRASIHIRDLDRHLADELVIALDRTRIIDRFLTRQVDSAKARGRVSVAWAAGRLAKVAVRVLPADERPRFGEEFQGELWELAAAGTAAAGRACPRPPSWPGRCWPACSPWPACSR